MYIYIYLFLVKYFFQCPAFTVKIGNFFMTSQNGPYRAPFDSARRETNESDEFRGVGHNSLFSSPLPPPGASCMTKHQKNVSHHLRYEAACCRVASALHVPSYRPNSHILPSDIVVRPHCT